MDMRIDKSRRDSQTGGICYLLVWGRSKSVSDFCNDPVFDSDIVISRFFSGRVYKKTVFNKHEKTSLNIRLL